MKELLEKIAGVLEDIASDHEEKVAALSKKSLEVTKEKIAKAIAIYNDVLGEKLSEDVATKIAADAEVMSVLEKIAFAKGKPSSLGEVSEKSAEDVMPTTKAERLAAANDRFVRRVTGMQ